MRKFCTSVRNYLQHAFVHFPSLARFRILAQEFEALHEILHIIGEIDGIHILILILVIGGEDNYYQKSQGLGYCFVRFYSLQ